MFKRILVPTDGSEITTKAVTTAVELARAGGQLYTSRKEPSPTRDLRDAAGAAAGVLRRAGAHRRGARQGRRRRRRRAGMECLGHTVEALHPWEAISTMPRTQHATSS